MLSKQLLLILAVIVLITADAATIRGSINNQNDNVDEEDRRLAKKCKDKKGTLKIKGDPRRLNCKTWAKQDFCENKLKKGSRLVEDLCPVSCDTCPTDEPTAPPTTLEPTTAPTTFEPTAAPTFECIDKKGKFKVKVNGH